MEAPFNKSVAIAAVTLPILLALSGCNKNNFDAEEVMLRCRNNIRFNLVMNSVERRDRTPNVDDGKVLTSNNRIYQFKVTYPAPEYVPGSWDFSQRDQIITVYCGYHPRSDTFLQTASLGSAHRYADTGKTY